MDLSMSDEVHSEVHSTAEIQPKDDVCHLLSLPLELRIVIYQHLFANANLSLDAGTSSISTGGFPWHLLSTCHQLQREAEPFLSSATTLHIRGLFPVTVRIPPRHLSALQHLVIEDTMAAFCKRALPLDLFSSLKTLELRNLTVFCKYHDEAFLLRPDGDECMIQLALFNLRRISMLLTHVCADPARGFQLLVCCQFVVSSVTHETIVGV
jgi:hypothetical protein